MEHAKRCYYEYPTIVNNIPKEKNVYSSSLLDYARMDNMLSKSQTDIGESSNLAQVAQTYSCSLDNKELYDDCICILSILAQASIDSCKRRQDVDITSEIKRLKALMNVKEHKYPEFWLGIKHGFNRNNINHKLHCPMNYLYNLTIARYKSTEKTLPMSYFFERFPLDINRRTCRKVENLITQYSIGLGEYNIRGERDNTEYLLLRNDFDDLITAIRSTNISGKYLGLYSWLLDRAFLITPQSVANAGTVKSVISKNKSLLVKTLWDVNSNNLLKVFSKNL